MFRSFVGDLRWIKSLKEHSIRLSTCDAELRLRVLARNRSPPCGFTDGFVYSCYVDKHFCHHCASTLESAELCCGAPRLYRSGLESELKLTELYNRWLHLDKAGG